MTLVSTAARGAGGAAGGLSVIQTITTASSATTIDFTSIPQTFTHLKLYFMGKSSDGGNPVDFYCRVNNDSGANYDYVYLRGSGGSATAVQVLAGTDGYYMGQMSGSGSTAAFVGASQLDLFFYTGTAFGKIGQVENGSRSDGTATGFQVRQLSGYWNNTAAVTRLTLRFASTQHFTDGSIAILYGI